MKPRERKNRICYGKFGGILVDQSVRERVLCPLMRQWGQELPTVRFVLRSKETGSLVKRHAISRKHKLFYYTEEHKASWKL